MKDFDQIAHQLRTKDPSEILAWSIKEYGDSITLASSFGAEDVVLIDKLARIRSDIDIFYLDTGLLFPQTYKTRDELARRYNLTFIRVVPRWTVDEQEKEKGAALWKRDPNQCCHIRKVEPLQKVLSHYKAWITGIRREQSPTRAHTQVVEWDDTFSICKLNPLAFWKKEEVWDYIHKNKVPYNPLHDQDYPSIGCIPCTRAVKPGEDPRAGRWSGSAKTECGLHRNRDQK
ncbi:phosphoadenylyl-sulfate reductase [Mechercharimyces sp. CAU 1602]|uniref:phosphoadenylyl-sulfate reductase n=1 Tax=Mechercharimyces sp. CAU 1602 TaxID=2973933 RepID=UPI00216151AF|nr:phosphoadenylyl-sulfate reductase [Mechercharimyces sp. CAU 1602]MCS1350038.1 phosphoadenylyl-sulfate reductase [Mechercharimyces sp. CAU 1602]